MRRVESGEDHFKHEVSQRNAQMTQFWCWAKSSAECFRTRISSNVNAGKSDPYSVTIA